jgi:hypothetical protein
VGDIGSIISVSPVLPYATAFPLSGIFLTFGGGSITGYNLYLDSPNNGTVTGAVNPVVPGVVAHETSLTGNSYTVSPPPPIRCGCKPSAPRARATGSARP